MRVRDLLAVAATATAMVLATGVRAEAAESTRPVAIWSMNEPSGARAMIDSSGHGHTGSIGDEVLTHVVVNGATAYRFSRLQPDTPPPHPDHLVTVPSRADLNPGTRDYSVTLRLRTTHHFGNIVQKGQATVEGGNFKFQIPNGVVQCLYRGSAGSVMVTADHAINNGAWHTVRCDRTHEGVTLVIDGEVSAHRSGWTGNIVNSWPVSIGGKTSCNQVTVGCDYYAGDLDRVEIDAR